MVFEVLARVLRREKDIKGIEVGKRRIKLSLLVDNIVLHLRDPHGLCQKAFDIIKIFSKV